MQTVCAWNGLSFLKSGIMPSASYNIVFDIILSDFIFYFK
ncbi:hypothetical protein HMPREF1545_00973 [Oscillibacter sp. KLE 1728]|nr:hypothetical protein HMPREF1545_00973 [Oscillibacter sp. KLE 1728]ERK65352.1 hypothetical protein HMPREF1546_01298 [Oscillibacter sp. KLE 1745]